MTIISEPIEGIAGADNNTTFVFQSAVLRTSGDDTTLITTRPTFLVAVSGVLTTPDLDPGPATVRIGQRSYSIEIPDSSTPVRLWPLIEAGLPVPPVEEASAVRNAGGVAMAKVSTLAAYQAISTPDPETLYVING